MSRSDLAGLQMVQGVPPFKFTAYGKTGDVLYCRPGILRPTSIDIPRAISKRVARTELQDGRKRIVNVWEAPWEVDD